MTNMVPVTLLLNDIGIGIVVLFGPLEVDIAMYCRKLLEIEGHLGHFSVGKGMFQLGRRPSRPAWMVRVMVPLAAQVQMFSDKPWKKTWLHWMFSKTSKLLNLTRFARVSHLFSYVVTRFQGISRPLRPLHSTRSHLRRPCRAAGHSPAARPGSRSWLAHRARTCRSVGRASSAASISAAPESSGPCRELFTATEEHMNPTTIWLETYRQVGANGFQKGYIIYNI